jgi:CRISPR/Cas system-associated endonuclease Cas1
MNSMNFLMGIEGDLMESYFRYWGKAEKEGAKYHLLRIDQLDVGKLEKKMRCRN